jgi:ketosteroid isomerase-like protein
MGVSPTNKKVSIPVCDIIELRDGKVYREREYMDMHHMMTQLGVAKAPATAKAR